MGAANGGVPLPAPPTEKVQKKMSVAQGVGLARARLPTAVGSQLSCAASLLTSVTPQRATILAAGGKERAREPVGLFRRGRAKGVAVGSRDRPTHVGKRPDALACPNGGPDGADFRLPGRSKAEKRAEMARFWRN